MAEHTAAAPILFLTGLAVDLERFYEMIGTTVLQTDDTDIEALLGRADKAPYAAQGSGRNRVCSQ